jgi:hypothetical protein
MTLVLVGTNAGCRVFTEQGQSMLELPGEPVRALIPSGAGGALAVVSNTQIWRRGAGRSWSLVANATSRLGSLTLHQETVFAGCADEATVFRTAPDRKLERLTGFDRTPGRETWRAEGPPLNTRSMTSTADDGALMAAVHVGGIPRSTDGGVTWHPTLPVEFDVHETRAHPDLPNVVTAAAAAGLCVSTDAGATWRAISGDGMTSTYSLAVAMLEEEVLFSLQDGPFANRSQLWRWRIGEDRAEPVREGLPEWLEGTVDTAHIAARDGRAAVIDGAGNLWLSDAGSRGWQPIARGVQDVFGLTVI